MNNHSFSGVIIRPMKTDDLLKVLDIERQSFSVPWTYDMFYDELTRNKYACYFILEKDKEIIGYLGFWHKQSSFHITNIAIVEKFRKKGYGGRLLKFVEKVGTSCKIKKIALEVRKSNYIAQNMYKKYGYRIKRIWKNYYREEREDALVMEKKL